MSHADESIRQDSSFDRGWQIISGIELIVPGEDRYLRIKLAVRYL